jgi:hypothetical protein
VHGGSLSLSSLFSGSPKLSWSSLDMTAEVRPGALAKYLRGVLAESSVPGAERAFVHMEPSGAILIVNKHRVPVKLEVIPPSAVKVTPVGTGAFESQLSNALATRVDVGPLPYGLRLTGIKVMTDAARVTAHAGKGSEKL